MNVKNISVAELADWLKAGQAVLVDVREPDEYKAGYIKGAVLVPLGGVTMDKIPAHQGRRLVMQCRSGGRSKTACLKLLATDAALDVYNLDGGILAWEKAGLPVEKSGA